MKWEDLRYKENVKLLLLHYISQASAEKQFRALNAQLNDINKKVEEASLNLADMENGKRRISSENGDLLHQLQELQNAANLLMKVKSGLMAALEEQKCVAGKV